MNTDLLRQVLTDQRLALENRNPGIPRQVEVNKHLKSKQISVITGVRRSGKSTFMLQLARKYKNFHHITFDDERLIGFSLEDFNNLMIEFKKENDSKVIVIDEVQLIDGWERFVRRIFDEGYKVILSGSNARLLSSELATHLTGRYILTELFPFSFSEFLSLKKLNPDNRSTENTAAIQLVFSQYLNQGGFPEFLINGEPEILKRVYDDILFRDIIVRFGIRNVRAFRNLSLYLYTNFTSEFGYLPLSELLEFSSANTVRDYIHFLSEAYLVYEVSRFDYSLKRQYTSAKKAYVIDNGLRNAIAFRTTQDRGRLLENLVYIELKRRFEHVWFYRTKNNLETDFLINPSNPELIQVCYDMSQPQTRKREIHSLLTSMQELNLKQGLILTNNEEGEFAESFGKIRLQPVWKWLC